MSLLVIVRPYFCLKLPASEWALAQPTEGMDVKLVSPDGRHELVLSILRAPNEPERSLERLDHVYRSYLGSAREQGPCEVAEDQAEDIPGPTNDCGFVVDYGGTVLRRRIQSVLACPGAFGEEGPWEVMANLALYSHGADRGEGERRFEAALAGLHVAPASHHAALGAGSIANAAGHTEDDGEEDDGDGDEEPPPDPSSIMPRPVSRTELAKYERVLPVWGIVDPTSALTTLGHDVFLTTATPSFNFPRVSTMQLTPSPDLSRAFDNAARHVDERCSQWHFTPRGQPVLVLHGHHLSVVFTLLAVLQPSFAVQLATRKVLACFPRPDLAALFADCPPDMREEARAFILQGAGAITLSDALFELTGSGGARPAP